MSQISMNCVWKSYLKNETDNRKKLNDKRVKEIEKLTSLFSKQKIGDEFKDFVSN